MKYILQLHTGSFNHSSISMQHAEAALKKIISRLDTSAVIWGWSKEYELNSAILNLLSKEKIKSYLWLPIFSEVSDTNNSDPFVFLKKTENIKIDLNEDEGFEFVCPSSNRNVLNAIEMYETIAKDLVFDGVFLDRIRYPSVPNSVYALAGCMCSRCREQYAKWNIFPEDLNSAIESPNGLLLPESFDTCKYTFSNDLMDSLFAVKRNIILDAVAKLASYFHNKGMLIGIDTFAPCLSDYVGQDLSRIADMVDFIKPMMYRSTEAPAGISFEMEAILGMSAESNGFLDRIWSGSVLSNASTKKQLQELMKYTGCIYPGIEINKIRDICNSDPEYVLESMKLFGEIGCSEVVLSWNISLIDDAILDALENFNAD